MKTKAVRIAKQRECSVERTLDIIGDRWIFLILREAFFGVKHYVEFQENLGIATNVLTQRLKTLTKNQIFEKKKDVNDARSVIYRLTPRGLDLYGVTLSLMGWGDRWLSDSDNAPLVLHHESCGHKLDMKVCCLHCGEEVLPQDVHYEG